MPGKRAALLVIREIASRIRDERIAAALSQEEAAARASIGYKRWQEIERGRVNPTVRTLVRVAASLDVEFWEIVKRRGRPEKRK